MGDITGDNLYGLFNSFTIPWKSWQNEMKESKLVSETQHYKVSTLAKKQECKCPKAVKQKLIPMQCGNCGCKIHIHGDTKMGDIDEIVCDECRVKGYWIFSEV